MSFLVIAPHQTFQDLVNGMPGSLSNELMIFFRVNHPPLADRAVAALLRADIAPSRRALMTLESALA